MYATDAHHPNRTLEEKLRSIYTLKGGPTIDLGFRPPYLTLLKRLGDPHLHLPPVIHVAGTNGKGSVISLLQALCEAGGYKVHRYTSPHLRRFNERIVLAGREIADEALEPLLDEVLAANDGGDVTFFELTTALAFTAFARAPADICLLEVGLGGRLDCTNVIEAPLATIITRISRDHVEYLGDTLPLIAAEKAGIMKPGAPCIIGPQGDESVGPVFEQHAAATPCPLLRFGREWNITPDGPDHMRFTYGADETVLSRPNLTGPHQMGNAGTALAALKSLDGFDIPDNKRQYALSHIRHPARLQRITDGSYTALLGPGQELWIDGGHNDSAGEILAAQAALWAAQDGKPLHIILGMMKHKDPAAFIAPLLPHAAGITCVPIPGEPQACSPGDLVRAIAAAGFGAARQAGSPKEALSSLQKYNTLKGSRVLVTGSFYLAGLLYDDENDDANDRPG